MAKSKKYQLTWRESEKRWKRKYRGQVSSFSIARRGLTKGESYPKALAEFKQWRERVDAKLDGTLTPHQQEYQLLVEFFAGWLARTEQAGQSHGWRAAKEMHDLAIEWRGQNIRYPSLPPSHGSKPAPPPPVNEPWNEPPAEPANGSPKPATLSEAIDRYLALVESRVGDGQGKRGKIDLGERSPRAVATDRRNAAPLDVSRSELWNDSD